MRFTRFALATAALLTALGALSAFASVTLTVPAPVSNPPLGAYLSITLQNCANPTIVNSGTPVNPALTYYFNGQSSLTMTIPDNVTQIACSGNMLSFYTLTYVVGGASTVIKSVELPPGTFNSANLYNITSPPFNPGVVVGPPGPAGPAGASGTGVSPEAYGAYADATVTTCSTTQGSFSLVCLGSAFTTVDVGKLVFVQGGNGSGQTFASASSAVSGNTVTLSASAPATGSFITILGHDDTAALQSCYSNGGATCSIGKGRVLNQYQTTGYLQAGSLSIPLHAAITGSGKVNGTKQFCEYNGDCAGIAPGPVQGVLISDIDFIGDPSLPLQRGFHAVPRPGAGFASGFLSDSAFIRLSFDGFPLEAVWLDGGGSTQYSGSPNQFLRFEQTVVTVTPRPHPQPLFRLTGQTAQTVCDQCNIGGNLGDFAGSVSGTTLTVLGTDANQGTVLTPGQTVFAAGMTTSTITAQLSGTTGGAGTYSISNSQTVANELMGSSYVPVCVSIGPQTASSNDSPGTIEFVHSTIQGCAVGMSVTGQANKIGFNYGDFEQVGVPLQTNSTSIMSFTHNQTRNAGFAGATVQPLGGTVGEIAWNNIQSGLTTIAGQSYAFTPPYVCQGYNVNTMTMHSNTSNQTLGGPPSSNCATIQLVPVNALTLYGNVAAINGGTTPIVNLSTPASAGETVSLIAAGTFYLGQGSGGNIGFGSFADATPAVGTQPTITLRGGDTVVLLKNDLVSPAYSVVSVSHTEGVDVPAAQLQVIDSTLINSKYGSYSFVGSAGQFYLHHARPDGTMANPFVFDDRSTGQVSIGLNGFNYSGPMAWGGGAAINTSNAIPRTGTPQGNHAACILSAGPPVSIGYCSTVVASDGSCTCN